MIELAKQKKVKTLFLEVRPSNKKAMALYGKFGFNEIGTRKDYYPAHRGREDAVVLALQL
jgi:ribosomal-protein-alanine N-acetyltransferase